MISLTGSSSIKNAREPNHARWGGSEADVNRCRQFGSAIRSIFSNQLAKTTGNGNISELNLPANSSIDHIIIQEDITQGERVREFKKEY